MAGSQFGSGSLEGAGSGQEGGEGGFQWEVSEAMSAQRRTNLAADRFAAMRVSAPATYPLESAGPSDTSSPPPSVLHTPEKGGLRGGRGRGGGSIEGYGGMSPPESRRARDLREWAQRTLGVSERRNSQVRGREAEAAVSQGRYPPQAEGGGGGGLVGVATPHTALAPSRTRGGGEGGEWSSTTSLSGEEHRSGGNHKQLLNVIDGILEIVSHDEA
jgi:hypothetical protein